MRHPPTAFLPPHAAMVRSAICYGSLMLLVVLTALPAFAASPDPFAYLYEETAPAKKPTLVDLIFGPKPDAFLVGLCLSAATVLGGWALYKAVRFWENPAKPILSTAIRWMSFAALATPAVSFRDASKDPAIDVLAKFVFVGGALWASAFAMGLMYGLIKTRAYPILNEQATSLIRENTRLGDAEMRVFYSTALNELNNNIPDAGLWAQCLAKTKGNEPAAKAKYLETRARELAKLATAQAREATQTPQTI